MTVHSWYRAESEDYRTKTSYDRRAILVAGDGTPFRVLLHRDAYDWKNRATIERWDGSAWQQVYALDGEQWPKETPGYPRWERSQADCSAALDVIEDRLVSIALEITR